MNNLIQSDPSIMMGKPVIAGTRITVELILEKLAAGESVEQILDSILRQEYSKLTLFIPFPRRRHEPLGR